MTDHAVTIATAVDRLNEGDVDGYIAMLYHPHCRFHGFPDAFGSDRDGIANFFRTLVRAVPDARISAADLIEQGDRVAVRYVLTGTHDGELLGAAGTGQALEVEGITIVRFQGDLVAERWNRLDDVKLLTQLGLMATAQAS
jgi:predicted ester cyclase